MNKILVIVIYLLLIVSTANAGQLSAEVPQQGYTTDILREPIFELAQVAIEVTAINNWLNLNYEKLSYEQMKGPREHLYYLIDSYVKGLYDKEKRILPEKHDLILEILFSWAEKLGVYGGALVYNSIKASNSPEMAPLMKIPDQMSLGLDGDLFKIVAKTEGWSVKIPYYFMISIVDDFTATNSQRTQLMMLSTGTALDNSEAGRSQATLLLMYSPGANLDDVANFWKQSIGIGEEAEKKSLKVNNLKSFYSFDPAVKLHKEITLWREPQGVFAIAYMGIDGTYQWNRPHFLDFLRSLEINSMTQ